VTTLDHKVVGRLSMKRRARRKSNQQQEPQQTCWAGNARLFSNSMKELHDKVPLQTMCTSQAIGFEPTVNKSTAAVVRSGCVERYKESAVKWPPGIPPGGSPILSTGALKK
jgi:hypothetical protein